MSKDPYYDRPEWSYSSMKKILESGIDYAVMAKRGDLPQPQGRFIDLGQLVHMLILGGSDNFAICEFDDFRTKAARDWRDEQLETGKNIVTKDMFKSAETIIKNIENHPYYHRYLSNDQIKHELEMTAKTSDGVSLKGKADAIEVGKDHIVITDIKTTAQFDKFEKAVFSKHYDLQAAVYSLIASSFLGISTNFVNYYFCVVETVEPYRVQYFHSSLEFLEAGESKLRKCIDEIVAFGDREPTPLLTEVKELGDWSL